MLEKEDPMLHAYVRSLLRFAPLCLVALTLTPDVQADTIFEANFQSGSIAGWSTTGNVFANLTSGNYSIGMTGGANARRTVPTTGYSRVSIALHVAASSLESADSCVAEVSIDGGASWANALTVTDGQDNGALYAVSTVAVNADNLTNLVIRFRANASSGDYCYGDNVVVSGVTTVGAAPAADSFAPLSGNGAVSRTALTYSGLMRSVVPGARVNYSAYALPGSAAAPTNFFQGRLSLHNMATTGGFAEVVDDFGYTNATDSPRKHLPPFDFELIQTGTHIFPVQRGSIGSTHADWEYVLSPGRVWNENSDNGFTRGAIPFALQQRNANCVHNGVLTFLFKNTGQTSNAAYQIVSETCKYFKADMWGVLTSAYTQYAVTNAATLKTAYHNEVNNRIPVRALANIGADYAGVNAAKLAAPNAKDPAHISLVGVYVDGKHYVGGCATRQGTYPYCESLVAPSYSVAKSAFGGLGMMRLEKKYPGARNTVVGPWVSECGNNGNWSDVTLNHALDMATGNYDSPDYMIDEDATHTNNLFLVDTHASKISYSCTQYIRKAPPGTKWVYHTSDTYIAGTVMNAYYRNQEGTAKDIFRDLIVGELYQALNVSPTARYTRRTYDSAAQPFTGWGLIWLRYDVAKIARFIGVDDGVLNGVAMLDTMQLDGAMQRNANDRGVVPLTDYYYNNGFWAHNAQTGLGCSSARWIPFMSGYGGISVLLLPNDVVYYYFSDDGVAKWMDAAIEAAKIRPIC